MAEPVKTKEYAVQGHYLCSNYDGTPHYRQWKSWVFCGFDLEHAKETLRSARKNFNPRSNELHQPNASRLVLIETTTTVMDEEPANG